jgi:hypothetical protein
MVTIDTSATLLFACFTYLVISSRWYRWNSFRWLKSFGVAELYFGSEYCTCNMYPIIVGCALQRFPRIKGFVSFFLFLPEVVGDTLGVFSLEAIALTLLFSLLLVRYSGWLDKILLGVFYWAKHAFVLL